MEARSNSVASLKCAGQLCIISSDVLPNMLHTLSITRITHVMCDICHSFNKECLREGDSRLYTPCMYILLYSIYIYYFVYWHADALQLHRRQQHGG